MANQISINALSEKSGVERRELKKALMREGVPFTKEGKAYLFDAEKAEAVANEILAKRKERPLPGIDPKTGLTWGQKLAKEKAREIELKNIETEREQSKAWVKVEEVDGMIRLLTDALDRFPAKWRSEHGLSERTVTATQRDIDTARRDAAAKLRK